MTMSLLSWVRCVVAMAFLCNIFNYQRAEQNKTSSFLEFAGYRFYNNCACGQKHSYNLAPLGRCDGFPSLVTQHADEEDYIYGYNPCRSFSLGQPSGCFEDVAICRWPANNASYQNIGKQTTIRCAFHKVTQRPVLVYTNNESLSHWKSVVFLKCNRSKKIPEFKFVTFAENTWRFTVASMYACSDPPPEGLEPSTMPTKPQANTRLEYILPICAVSFLVIASSLFIYIKRNWRCVRRENGHDNERQPLNRGNIRVEYAANHLNEPAERRGPDNSQNEPQPSSASNRSRNNIPVANNDNFNSGSNRHHSTAVLG